MTLQTRSPSSHAKTPSSPHCRTLLRSPSEQTPVWSVSLQVCAREGSSRGWQPVLRHQEISRSVRGIFFSTKAVSPKFTRSSLRVHITAGTNNVSAGRQIHGWQGRNGNRARTEHRSAWPRISRGQRWCGCAARPRLARRARNELYCGAAGQLQQAAKALPI